MAYPTSPVDRMDELRFRSQQSPRHDTSLMGLVSPPRNGTRVAPNDHTNEARGSLTRRFTTDSGRVPTITSMAIQRGQETQEYIPSTYHKVQLLEKKKLEYERLREQKRRFEAEMQLLDLQQRREEQELAQMQEDLGRTSNSGHQSEPTTPPEYRDTGNGFPSVFSRPNRYSTSSLTSPSGLYTRPGRSGSTLMSPQSGILQSRLMMDDKARSMGASRHNSDDDEKEEAVRQDPTSHRSTNALNRYSMPVTKSRTSMNDILSFDPNGTARFLIGDDDSAQPADTKSYLQMHSTEDKFPILVRRDGLPGVLSASSAALDLASPSPNPETQQANWTPFAPRHRAGQQSLPVNTMGVSSQNGGATTSAGMSSIAATAESPASTRQSWRNSIDLKFLSEAQQESVQVASPTKTVQATPPKLQSSYSSNDVPTVKSPNGAAPAVTPNNHAQQHLHNHNASIGRYPANAVNNRHSREMSSGGAGAGGDGSPAAPASTYQSISSALHGNAPAFGPSMGQGTPQTQSESMSNITSPSNMSPYGAMPGYYSHYAPMSMMTMGMQNMGLGQPMYPPNPYAAGYPAPAYHGPPGGGHHAPRDSQARVIAQRRQQDGEAMSRFQNVPLEQHAGEIYSLCKDQHGCRYLQKKLEERKPQEVHMIWLETNQHVIELMTDPFGNYLCQKLLEYCNDEERTVLIEQASRDLVRIALNQHGTRALQKMIEHVSTPAQVQLIIHALRFKVVDLIQDLNGNHVIQKCLNKLSPMDAQFIFDAVGNHVIDVGTHRHGCCVLQRCIDHATGEQKAWLIRQISDHAIHLVQDPFGNYVVQYILDLNEPVFTEPLVAMFHTRVPQLSRQKFSSNVIEKCLRCAQEPSKDMIVDEILNPAELEKLLRDSFANYVIQTALDYANPPMKVRLVEAIRPFLPVIRTTPYGRRIQAKIQGAGAAGGEVVGRSSGNSSGQGTPADNSNGQVSLRQLHNRGFSNASSGTFSNAFGNGSAVSSPNHGGSPSQFPTSGQIVGGRGNSHMPTSPPYYPYGRGSAMTGGPNYF